LCRIVAVSDPVMGEVVGAFVQRENSAAGRALKGTDLAKHIKNILSHQSAPDWVWFLAEDGVETEYPKTASGKIVRVEIISFLVQ
jgi:acyl-CoA synthetase (AMP-forming)/AMP-acid ligase II